MTCSPAWTQVPGAADLLAGISVYREPVDRNAVLFQAGQPDPAAEDIPGPGRRLPADHRDPGRRRDPRGRVRSTWRACRTRSGRELAPHLAELNRPPVPPFRPRPGLAGQIGACQAAGLLTVSRDRAGAAVLRAPVDRHRAGRPPAPSAAAGRRAPAGRRLLAVAGPGLAAGPGRRRA